MATQYENYITNDDHAYACEYWKGQSFTPSVDHIITSVWVKLYRAGTPGTVYCRIHTIAGGKPDTTALCTGTYNGNLLGTGSSGAWIEITFSPGALLFSGTEYVLMIGGGDSSSNLIYWRDDVTSPTYTGGDVHHNQTTTAPTAPQAGDTYLNFDYDFMFEEWGDPEGTGGGGSIYPSVAITRVTGLVHRYDRRKGIYQLEVSLGDVTSFMELPGSGRPLRATKDKEAEELRKGLGIVEQFPSEVPPPSEVATRRRRELGIVERFPGEVPPGFRMPPRKPAPRPSAGRGEFPGEVPPGFKMPAPPKLRPRDRPRRPATHRVLSSAKVTEERPIENIRPGALQKAKKYFDKKTESQRAAEKRRRESRDNKRWLYT